MALDFYKLDDVKLKNRLFSIEISELKYVNEILDQLREVSGVSINLYGTTRIYADHLKFITSGIKENLNKLTEWDTKRIPLTKLYDSFSNINEGFVIIGE